MFAVTTRAKFLYHPLLDIVIELPDDPARPAYQRLAEAIRESILGGRFRPGERLPPTRVLAGNLSLARNTVLEAYEQLIAEGYLQARHGSGTYVAPDLPDRAFRAESYGASIARDGHGAPPRLSAFAERLMESEVPTAIDEETQRPTHYEFRYGTPSFDEFPIDAWRTLTKRVLDLLAKLAKDDAAKYQGFWDEFGAVLKEGLAEDHANRDKLLPLLRFATTSGEGYAETVSLADYVARM